MDQPKLTGSCLCGGVRYTVQGEQQRFYNCYCSRCRKATGSAHSSNLFVGGTLSWDSGEDLVRSFKVPEAARFANHFCSVCGARVPRFIAQAGIVFIPAGSLDVEPALHPQARIFMDSRTAWSCTVEPLPEFAEYVT